MPSPAHSSWRADRPAEGFYTTALAGDPSARPVRTFLPDGYEPRYPYPLLVLFHGRGGDDEQVLRLAPRVSRRNFVAVSLRGPADDADLDDYLWRAVEHTRRAYHIHSERVYLVGVGGGGDPAYRAAFALGRRLAGVAVLNGRMPRPQPGRPLFALDAVRGQRVFLGHGLANPAVPLAAAERDRRLLWAAGADVTLTAYPTAHTLHPHMLRDLNRWVIGHLSPAPSAALAR